MSFDQEIAKAIINKVTPFGNPISKKLLTPCRQVGLSRKRKTPNSTSKLLLASPVESNTAESFNTTPLNHKAASAKLETRSLIFDSPLIEQKSTTKQNVKTKANSNKTAKKTLAQTFSSDLFNELNVSNSNDLNEDDLASVLNTTADNDKLINTNVSKLPKLDNKQDEDDSKPLDKKSESNKCLSLEVPKIKNNRTSVSEGNIVNKNCENNSNLPKSKSNINYESEDDFTIADTNYGKNKSKRKSSKNKEIKQNLKTENSENTSKVDLKSCKISIRKLSDAEINANTSKASISKYKITKSTYVSDDDDDDDFVVTKRKKVNLIVSDDSDFQSTPEESQNSNIVKIKTQAIVHSFEKNMATQLVEEKENKLEKSNTKVQNTSNVKTNNIVKSSRKILSILDDEDDDFTSTPEREKNEKIQLIEKIQFLEKQINKKRTKLADLQQAAIYKSKHNVEELQSLTEQWRQGCNLGLNALLANLQQHRPIDMITLLHNLHIPLDIAKSKIKIIPDI